MITNDHDAPNTHHPPNPDRPLDDAAELTDGMTAAIDEHRTAIAETPAPPGVLALAVARFEHEHGPFPLDYDEAGRSDGDDGPAALRRIAALDARAARTPIAARVRETIHAVRGRAHLVLGVLLLVGLVLGAFSGFAAMRADDGRPVNVFWLLGVILGGQTLLLVAWCALALGGRATLRRLSLGGIAVGIAERSAIRIAGTGEGDDRRARAAATLATLACDLGGRRGAWIVSAVSHAVWTVFDLAVIAAVVVVLSVRQFDFGWETTLLDDEAYTRATTVLGAGPAAIGFPVPAPEEVAASRIDPSSGALVGGASGSPVDPDLRRRWSGLVIGSITLYGLAPRLLLTIGCVAVAARSRRRWRPDLDAPWFANARRRMQPESRRLDIVDADDTGARTDGSAIPPAHAAERPLGSPVVLGIELDAPVSGWPPITLDHLVDHGIIASREEIAAAEERLASASERPSALAIAIDLATTPDRGVERTITRLVRAATPMEATLLLSGGDRFRARRDARSLDRRVADWNALAARVPMRADAIDLDVLTASTRARLERLLRGSTAEQRTDQRMDGNGDRTATTVPGAAGTNAVEAEHDPIALFHGMTEAIARAQRGWDSPPDATRQAELHRELARLAGAASPRFGGDLRTLARRLLESPAETIGDAAARGRRLLPPRLSSSARWLAIGGAVGALGCVATAGLAAPIALAALPGWTATGAALAGALDLSRGFRRAGSGDAASPDSNDDRPTRANDADGANARGDAIAAAMLSAIVLAFQGLGETTIQDAIRASLDDEPPVFHDAATGDRWIENTRARVVSWWNERASRAGSEQS